MTDSDNDYNFILIQNLEIFVNIYYSTFFIYFFSHKYYNYN